VARHHLKISHSHEAMAELGVVLEVDVGEVTTMNITERLVEVGLLIQAGVVGLSHLRHHLHKFLLLVLHLPMPQWVSLQQVLVRPLLQRRRVSFLV